jgi:hypothetical protein
MNPSDILGQTFYVGLESFNGYFPSNDIKNAVALFTTLDEAETWREGWRYRRVEVMTFAEIFVAVTQGLRRADLR